MRERGRQKIGFSVASFLSSGRTLLQQHSSKPMHGKQRIQAIEEDVVYYEDGADTVKTSVPSPRTLERRLEVEIKNKREVRNAIDQGREDAVKSGVTDIEGSTSSSINTSIAHLDGSQGSAEATMTVPAAASGPKVKDKNLDSVDLDQPKSTYAHHALAHAGAHAARKRGFEVFGNLTPGDGRVSPITAHQNLNMPMAKIMLKFVV